MYVLYVITECLIDSVALWYPNIGTDLEKYWEGPVRLSVRCVSSFPLSFHALRFSPALPYDFKIIKLS